MTDSTILQCASTFSWVSSLSYSTTIDLSKDTCIFMRDFEVLLIVHSFLHLLTLSRSRSSKHFLGNHTFECFHSLGIYTYKMYSALCSTPFMIVSTPFETSSAQPKALYLHPHQSRILGKIKFLLHLRTCLTPINTLSQPSYILILTSPILATLHVYPFPI